jgi:hypothetical protein
MNAEQFAAIKDRVNKAYFYYGMIFGPQQPHDITEGCDAYQITSMHAELRDDVKEMQSTIRFFNRRKAPVPDSVLEDYTFMRSIGLRPSL